MDCRAFLGILALLTAPLGAEAQLAGKLYPIGYLSSSSPTSVPQPLEAVRQGLRELGHVEGQNTAIERRGTFPVRDTRPTP